MSTDAPALREQQVLYGIVGDRIDRVTRRVPVDEPPPLAENATLHVIGERLPRLDAIQKVTGRARYTFDVQLPGMLYAMRVVSTVPHARILDIDTSEAERYPGVRAVHVLDRQLQTAQLRDPSSEKPRYPIVRYHGQPIAGVAAISQRAADAAAALVKIKYDVIPHVSDMDEAMKEDAPAVFAGPTEQPPTAGGGGACAARTPVRPSACREATWRKGSRPPTSLSTPNTVHRSRRTSRWRRTASSPTGPTTCSPLTREA